MEPTYMNNLEQEMTCPIEYTLLTDAVSLEPCMHKVSEVAAEKMFARENGKICPTCQGNVSKYAVDQQMRNLAQGFEKFKNSVMQAASLPKEEKVEEKKAEEKASLPLPDIDCTGCSELKVLPPLPNIGNNAADEMEVVFRGKRFSLAEGILDFAQEKDITDEDLAWFAERAPHLKQLTVSSDKITSIPFQHLEKLACYRCTSLTMIFAPEAEEIICSKSAVSEVIAPKAKKVNIWDCSSLCELNLESAEDVKVTSCYKLAKLDLPLAKTVDCSDCGLKELSLPQATYIKCRGVNKIKKQEFPQAETVICTICEFEELTLPKVKLYDDSYSKNMKLVIPKDAKFERLSY